MHWSSRDTTKWVDMKGEKQTLCFNNNQFKGVYWKEESPKESVPCPLAIFDSKHGRCCWKTIQVLSDPLLMVRDKHFEVQTSCQIKGVRGEPPRESDEPLWDGFGCMWKRLFVTEPFSSACEMLVVTELRPAKGPFTVHGGEVKKKTILLKSKYSF